MPLSDRIYCCNFVIAKIVVGFIVGGGGGIVFFVDCSNLTSLAILVNGLELHGESHGLVQRILVGRHDISSDRFIEACQKQLMLEKLLSITNVFPFAFGEVGYSHRNGHGGNVGWNNSECSNVGRLGLTHFEECIVHSKEVIMYTFTLTLGELLEVSAFDLFRVPWLIAGQKLVLDGIPVVSGDTGVL